MHPPQHIYSRNHALKQHIYSRYHALKQHIYSRNHYALNNALRSYDCSPAVPEEAFYVFVGTAMFLLTEMGLVMIIDADYRSKPFVFHCMVYVRRPTHALATFACR